MVAEVTTKLMKARYSFVVLIILAGFVLEIDLKGFTTMERPQGNPISKDTLLVIEALYNYQKVTLFT